MEISLENLYVDLVGPKGLIVHTYTLQTLLGTCEECEIGFLLGYSFRNCPRASIRCFQQCATRDSMLHSQHNLHASFFFLIA